MVSRSAVWSLAAVAILTLAACSSNAATAPTPSAEAISPSEPPVTGYPSLDGGTYRIVTLGDSYTLGTGTEAPRRDSWPSQLKELLMQRTGMHINLYNFAGDSSTSDEVLEEQLRQVADQEPDVVTLQVGLNDIVSDSAEWAGWYGDNIGLIFDELLRIVPADHVFAITTPDHTLTEWGRAYGDHQTVEALNDILREEAQERSIQVIDIGPVNERVTLDSDLLVAGDQPNPYPTAKQYAGWAETIGHYIYAALMSADP